MSRHTLIIFSTLTAILSAISSGAAEAATWGNCLSAPSNECMLSVARELATATSDAPLQAELLSRIAIAQGKAGRRAEAHDTLELAEKAARAEGSGEASDFGDFRALAWADVARGWIGIHERDRATQLFESAPDDSARREVIKAVGEALLEDGNIAAALDFSKRAEDPDSLLRILPAVAEAQIATSNIDAARNTFALIRDAAKEMPDEASQVFYLAALGKLQADSGLIDEALQTAAGITGFTNHGWLVRQIALAQAKSGNFGEARETLGAIEDTVALVLGYARVGSIAVAADERDMAEDFFAEGLAIARAMANGEERDHAVGRVAWHRAEAGDHGRAVELLAEIEETGIRDWITRIVVGEATKTGRFDEAASTASSLRDIVHRARAYTEIAAAHATSGDNAAADMTFALALDTAKEIPDTMTRDGVYGFIVEEQARAENFAGALKTAEMLQATGDLNRALAETAVQIARTGDIPGAMELLRRVGPVSASADALVRIASPDSDER